METIYTVKYQIATYSGTVKVTADADDDEKTIVAKAKKILYEAGHPGVVYEKFYILLG